MDTAGCGYVETGNLQAKQWLFRELVKLVKISPHRQNLFSEELAKNN